MIQFYCSGGDNVRTVKPKFVLYLNEQGGGEGGEI